MFGLHGSGPRWRRRFSGAGMGPGMGSSSTVRPATVAEVAAVPRLELVSGGRFLLAVSGEIVQLVRPARPGPMLSGDDLWFASVVFPYSAQRDLIVRPAQLVAVAS